MNVYNTMTDAFPVFRTYNACDVSCNKWASHCTGTEPSVSCEINFNLFLVVIFLAIFTGVFVSCLCIVCWVGGCSRNGDDKRLRWFWFLRRDRDRDDAQSLCSSNLPSGAGAAAGGQQVKSKTSTLSLPNFRPVEIEESSSSDEWKALSKQRVRKITFDLSATRPCHV